MRRGGRRVGYVGLAGMVVLAAGVTSSLGVHGPTTRVRPYADLPPAGLHHATTLRLLSTAQCLATPGIRLPCFDPAQLQAAYDLQPLFSEGIDGAGQTIAIVDSFGSPTMAADLAVFDARLHLPAPPSLRVIQPAGAVPPYDPTNTTVVGWAGETTLDVEWAHAMAPRAAILLVETPVSETEGVTGFPQIVAAETYVVEHHLADVITQSFGATEGTFPSPQSIYSLRGAFVDAARAGVTVVAAAGDTGATGYTDVTATHYSTKPVVTWPASDPLVTAVGGTRVGLDDAGVRVAPDRVWNDTYDAAVNRYLFGTTTPHPDATGGGLSSVFGRPSYQDGVAAAVGGRRGIPDISMNGACSTLVDTYQSFPGQPAGWYFVCGTSESAPMFAGIVALADQLAGHPLGAVNPAIYAMAAAHAPGIVDVTAGSNTVTFAQTGRVHTVVGYRGVPGYDLASGVGTIDAARFVPELVAASAVAPPASLTPLPPTGGAPATGAPPVTATSPGSGAASATPTQPSTAVRGRPPAVLRRSARR